MKHQTLTILKTNKMKDMKRDKGRRQGFYFSGEQSLSVRLDLKTDYEEEVKRALGKGLDAPIIKPSRFEVILISNRVQIKYNKPPTRKPVITTTSKVKETHVEHQSPGRKMYTRVSAGNSPTNKIDNSGKKATVKDSKLKR